MTCPNCRVDSAEGSVDCPGCGLIFAKWAQKVRQEKDAGLMSAGAAPRVQGDNAAIAARQNIIIAAVVFVVAGLLANVQLGRFLVESAIAMQVHELGHALVSCLGGLIAVPIPMLTLVLGEERSVLFAIVVAAGLLWLLKTAWAENCRVFAVLCAMLLLLQGWLTLIVTRSALGFWVSFGGLGGECCVSALLIILYFHPLPRVLQWPKVRLVFLFIGASVLAVSLRRWMDASRDFEKVPWGSFFGGDGDVESMIAGGWTVNTLVKVYLRLSWACAFTVGLAYALAAWPARAELMKHERGHL